MGNGGGTIFVRDNEKYVIDVSQLDYGTTIANLKRFFRISSESCIVLRNLKQNNFVSTSHKWDEFKSLKKSKIIVLDQVSESIKINPLNISISKCIFKILNNHRVVGLGVKISEIFCICPKGVRLQENFKEFCRNSTIEFFDGRTGEFLENGFHEVLGEKENEKQFFICQINLNCDFLKMKLYDGYQGVKGDCIYFSKETQMLGSFSYSRIHTNAHNFYTLRNPEDSKTWLPGSIMFGKEKRINENEDENVIGIYFGGSLFSWYSMNTIISQICDKYTTSADKNFKNAVLGIKSLRFKLDSLAPVLIERVKIDERTVKPKNKFREIYN